MLLRVRNTGDLAAAGGHVDRLVLSSDSNVDASDLVLAEVLRDGALAIGDSYTVSVEARVQDGRNGDFRLILEIFVAFVQAFIFTLLTSLFVGSSMHRH